MGFTRSQCPAQNVGNDCPVKCGLARQGERKCAKIECKVCTVGVVVTKQHVFHVHISPGPPPPSASSPPLHHPSSSSSRLVPVLFLPPRLNPRLHPHPSPHPPPHPLVRSPASSSSSIIHPRTQPSFQDSIVDSFFLCLFSHCLYCIYRCLDHDFSFFPLDKRASSFHSN